MKIKILLIIMFMNNVPFFRLLFEKSRFYSYFLRLKKSFQKKCVIKINFFENALKT